jgi:hypothetical protein
VAEGLLRLASEADVVALAQASMARVLKALPAGQPAAPVLTSPELAIEQIRAALA